LIAQAIHIETGKEKPPALTGGLKTSNERALMRLSHRRVNLTDHRSCCKPCSEKRAKMSKRKPISKKVRFEVFKRDSFTCQYCGCKSPDVVLHVDHIKPVSKDGDNNLMNLITSCIDCNLGKGARELDDHAELVKQRDQLDDLNERRLQLEQMVLWREELKVIDADIVDRLSDVWCDYVPSYSLGEGGLKELSKLSKKFGYETVSIAMETSTDQYLRHKANGDPTHDSVELAWSKLGGIAYFMANPAKKMHSDEAYYIRGILRNRLHYVNERSVLSLITRAENLNVNMEGLKEIALNISSWSGFEEKLLNYILKYSEEYGGS